MCKLVKFSGQLPLPDYETNPPIIQTTSGGTYAPGLIEVIKKSERSPSASDKKRNQGGFSLYLLAAKAGAWKELKKPGRSATPK
jgi:hypothetical protein